ncbi:MAG TPA: hypothetical protein PLI49_17365 [Leptospiraceae bacterium]|nr:hypothetical protein [Leptospiraceae bacterium]
MKKKNFHLSHLDGFEFQEADQDTFDSWFNTEKGDHSKFLYSFAQDGTGGLFCLWNESRSNDFQNANVVYLSSEGDFGVLAANFDDFLSVLAGGLNLYDLIFYGNVTPYQDLINDEDELLEAKTNHQKLVKWIQTEFQIRPEMDGPKILQRGKHLLAPFKKWVVSRMGNY